MKARPFKATPVPSLAGKGANDTISQAQLVALVASRAERNAADDEGTVRNRVRSLVDYDVKGGRLPREQNRFRLGDVAYWASSRWPDRYHDLPRDEGVGHGEFSIAVTILNAVGYELPTNIEHAHRAIAEMQKTIELLRRELEGERAKVRELEPDATRWRNWNKSKGRRRMP